MNVSLILAGVVVIALGLVHSLLGEKLIFWRLNSLDFSASAEPNRLTRRHWAALRATWHLASLLAWGFAAILFWLSSSDAIQDQKHWLLSLIAVTFLAAAVYWVVQTRGKHPGWIPMLLVALLVWWS